MAAYLSEIKTLSDQLDSISAAIPESEKIFGMLTGLGREYESICAVIENSMDSDPPPSLDDVMSKLVSFDDKLQTYAASSEVTPHQAFYTDRGGYSGRGRGGQHRGGYRGRGYSTQGRGFYQQFGPSNGRGTQQNASRPTCQICGKYGHEAFKCYKRFDLHFQPSAQPQANTVMRTDESGLDGNDWYPDTAATHHITNSTQHL